MVSSCFGMGSCLYAAVSGCGSLLQQQARPPVPSPQVLTEFSSAKGETFALLCLGAEAFHVTHGSTWSTGRAWLLSVSLQLPASEWPVLPK